MSMDNAVSSPTDKELLEQLLSSEVKRTFLELFRKVRVKRTFPKNGAEGKVCVKNTFLEPVMTDEVEEKAESTTRSQNKSRRSVTDTVVDYGNDLEDFCGNADEAEADGQPMRVDLDSLAALRPILGPLAKWRQRSSTKGSLSTLSSIGESGVGEVSGETGVTEESDAPARQVSSDSLSSESDEYQLLSSEVKRTFLELFKKVRVKREGPPKSAEPNSLKPLLPYLGPLAQWRLRSSTAGSCNTLGSIGETDAGEESGGEAGDGIVNAKAEKLFGDGGLNLSDSSTADGFDICEPSSSEAETDAPAGPIPYQQGSPCTSEPDEDQLSEEVKRAFLELFRKVRVKSEVQPKHAQPDALAPLRPWLGPLAQWRLRSSKAGSGNTLGSIGETQVDEESGGDIDEKGVKAEADSGINPSDGSTADGFDICEPSSSEAEIDATTGQGNSITMEPEDAQLLSGEVTRIFLELFRKVRVKRTFPENGVAEKVRVKNTFLEPVMLDEVEEEESTPRSEIQKKRSLSCNALNELVARCDDPEDSLPAGMTQRIHSGGTNSVETKGQPMRVELDTFGALKPWLEPLAKWRHRSSTAGSRNSVSSIGESGIDEASGEAGVIDECGEAAADTDDEEATHESAKLVRQLSDPDIGVKPSGTPATPIPFQPQPRQGDALSLPPSMTFPFWPQQSGDKVSDNIRAAEMDEQAARLKEAAKQLEIGAQLLRQRTEEATKAANAEKLASTATTTWLKKTAARPEKAGSRQLNQAVPVPEEKRTTVMLRHLPAGYTRAALLELLDSQGFKGCYDFVYLPVNFVKMLEFGYAFVNLISHAEASRVWKHFDGFADWPAHPDVKETGEALRACEISWGEPLQGLSVHIDRYRNSPVMHKDTPERFKPLIFANGVKVKFPPPTKRIRPPRLKHGSPSADLSAILAAHAEQQQAQSATE